MINRDADVIVVGLGAMGANALWRLAARGVDVLGIERYGMGHNQGSSHGATRLFRTACMEHPGLVPLAQDSYRLWRELEATTDTHLLDITGALMIGPRDGHVAGGTLKSARNNGFDVRVLTPNEVAEKFPQHADVDPHHIAVLDPQAGVVRPEDGVHAACQAALALGATIHADTRVTAIDLITGGVRVSTATGSYSASQVIVTTGPWLDKLIPQAPVEPIRQPMTWFHPRDSGPEFDIEHFPVFIREWDDGSSMWGHGATARHPVKIGPEDDGTAPRADPDTIDRGVSAADYAYVSSLIERGLPGLDPIPVRTTVCMITRSPDGLFQLGRPAGDPRLIIGGGCSGHAFKHATGIGEALAQMAIGEPQTVDIGFADPNRFN